MASSAVGYAKENQQRFLGELKDLLRIPSVSTAPEHKDDVRRAAEYVANNLRTIGMENVEIIQTKGHPLIYADWLHALTSAGFEYRTTIFWHDDQPGLGTDRGTPDSTEENRSSDPFAISCIPTLIRTLTSPAASTGTASSTCGPYASIGDCLRGTCGLSNRR